MLYFCLKLIIIFNISGWLPSFDYTYSCNADCTECSLSNCNKSVYWLWILMHPDPVACVQEQRILLSVVNNTLIYYLEYHIQYFSSEQKETKW
jgi:hypothetical protein